MNKIWKDVEDYEGYYQVSNMGRVKSLGRRVWHSRGYYMSIKERILKKSSDNSGYLIVVLSLNGRPKTFGAHRLVALHFILNPDNLPQVNHIDSDKSNNNVSNLEWCDATYNNLHSTYIGNSQYRLGEANPNAKITEADKLKMFELRKQGCTQEQIAKRYNCSQTQVGRILNKKSRNTKKQEEMKKAFKAKYDESMITEKQAYYDRCIKRIQENIMELKRQETEHIRLMEIDAAVQLQRERATLLITKDILKEELAK